MVKHQKVSKYYENGCGNHTKLKISNDDMQDLLKAVKSLEDSGILLDEVTETVKNEVKEQKGGFLSILLGTLGASLLGDLLIKILSGKGVIRAGEGKFELVMDLKNFDSPPTDKLCNTSVLSKWTKHWSLFQR